MDTEKKIPRRASGKDLADKLLQRMQDAINKGMSAEDAMETLTKRQYDWLCDYPGYGERIDNLTMTIEQKAAIKEVVKAARPKGLIYNKKYPADKIALYGELVEFVKARGAVIAVKEKKENYRDLDFTIEGTAYRIVLSNPRPKKE